MTRVTTTLTCTGAGSVAASDMASKALSVQRVLHLKFQSLALRRRAPPRADRSRPATVPGPGKSGTDCRAEPEPVAGYGRTSLGEQCRMRCRPSSSPLNQGSQSRMRITEHPPSVPRGRTPGNLCASTRRRGLRTVGIRPSYQMAAAPAEASDPVNLGPCA